MICHCPLTTGVGLGFSSPKHPQVTSTLEVLVAVPDIVIELIEPGFAGGGSGTPIADTMVMLHPIAQLQEWRC